MQCEHHQISLHRSKRGPRCRRIARWKLYPRNGEGSTVCCTAHRDAMLSRADLVCKPLRTMGCKYHIIDVKGCALCSQEAN